MSNRVALLAASVAAIVGLAPAAGAAALTARPGGVMSGVSLHSIVCESSTSCLAVGSNSKGDGQAVLIVPSSASGKAGGNDLAGKFLDEVACPTSSQCLATTAGGEVVRVSTSSGDITKAATVSAPKGWTVSLGHIACASSTACYAVGYDAKAGTSTRGVFVRLSGTGKVLGTVIEKTVQGFSSIACPTATRCLVVAGTSTGASEVQLVDKGSLGSEHAFPTGYGVAALACYGDSVCYALASKSSGPGGYIPKSPFLANVNPTTGATGKEIAIPGTFYGTGVACASGSACVAVGIAKSGSSYRVEAVVFKKAKVSGTDSLAGNMDGSTSVACATSSSCDAVNSYGPPTYIDRISV